MSIWNATPSGSALEGPVSGHLATSGGPCGWGLHSPRRTGRAFSLHEQFPRLPSWHHPGLKNILSGSAPQDLLRGQQDSPGASPRANKGGDEDFYFLKAEDGGPARPHEGWGVRLLWLLPGGAENSLKGRGGELASLSTCV